MIHEYAMRGDLPFDVDFEKQPCGNWHWLNMRSEGVLGHVVKTEKHDMFPKDGPARQDKRITNQGDFFEAPRLVDLAEALSSDSDIYAWLSYGCDRFGNITHALWGVPAADQNVYLASVDILDSAIKQGDPAPTDKTVAPSFGIQFTEQVAEALRKSKEEGDKDVGAAGA